MKDALRAFGADLTAYGLLAGQFDTVNKGSLGVVDASWGETIIAGVSAYSGSPRTGSVPAIKIIGMSRRGPMSDSYGDAPYNTRETRYMAGGAPASGPATCARCAAPLAAGAAFCQRCGQPVAGAPPAGTAAAAPAPASQDRRPATGLQVSQFVVVTGRARTAGWLLAGGGAALLLSAFLPWVSFLGIVSGHLPAGYFFVFGAVGCVLAYFGVRALKDRMTRAIMATLWVLAALAALVAIGVFAAGQNLAHQYAGTVSLASGFYVGLLGLVATVVGTILLQTTRRSSRARRSSRQAGSAVQLSQDGAYWWDGTNWHSVTADAPPNAPRSPDGTSWWDGTQWHRVP